MKGYLSLIFSLIPNAIAVVVAATATGHITQAIGIGIVIAILQPAIVYLTPNLPDALYVKAVLAGLLAGAQLAVQLIGVGGLGGFTVAQWTMVAGAVLAAAGVILRPNQPPVQAARLPRSPQSGQARLRFAALLALGAVLFGLANIAWLERFGPINAHAALSAACGNPFDGVGVPYAENYQRNTDNGRTAPSVYDYYPASPVTHHPLYTDEQDWRMVDPNSGHCDRGYYASIWTGDGTPMNTQTHIDVWACGVYAGGYNSPVTYGTPHNIGYYQWADRDWDVTLGAKSGGSLQPVYTTNVSVPGGTTNLDMYDYTAGDGHLCGPQMANAWTSGGTGTWAWTAQTTWVCCFNRLTAAATENSQHPNTTAYTTMVYVNR